MPENLTADNPHEAFSVGNILVTRDCVTGDVNVWTYADERMAKAFADAINTGLARP